MKREARRPLFHLRRFEVPELLLELQGPPAVDPEVSEPQTTDPEESPTHRDPRTGPEPGTRLVAWRCRAVGAVDQSGVVDRHDRICLHAPVALWYATAAVVVTLRSRTGREQNGNEENN